MNDNLKCAIALKAYCNSRSESGEMCRGCDFECGYNRCKLNISSVGVWNLTDDVYDIESERNDGYIVAYDIDGKYHDFNMICNYIDWNDPIAIFKYKSSEIELLLETIPIERIAYVKNLITQDERIHVKEDMDKNDEETILSKDFNLSNSDEG